jgi:hypothetical protein
VAVKIVAGSAGVAPTMSVAWCADNQGEGSPTVTTSDGTKDALVWTAGAEASNQLHAWDALTGAPVFTGGGTGDSMSGLRHLMTVIAVHGKVLAAGDGRLYAFAPK